MKLTCLFLFTCLLLSVTINYYSAKTIDELEVKNENKDFECFCKMARQDSINEQRFNRLLKK